MKPSQLSIPREPELIPSRPRGSAAWDWILFSSALFIAINPLQAQPLSPVDQLKTFHFADTNLTAELAAAEPLVNSPVAIAWDASERLFVAEMRDYPNAATGGAIRQLADLDRDGRYETSTLYAEGLSYPNSILPWNNGLLVTAAPDLWFFSDANNDGRADEKRVLFTGFGAGNQQLRANGLTWGLDGWIYGANGRSDGNVRAASAWQGASWAEIGPLLRQTNSLRGRDFRFRPLSGAFETLAGRSQFGLARDDWGNRFLSWNTIPVRHEVFPDRFLARNPLLPPADVLIDLSPAGDSGPIFPLTPSPLVFNNESSSHFNALAGLTLFRGRALGSSYYGSVFLGETLRNLVHRRVLVPNGVSFSAQRVEEGAEFLRSTDPWFHPVNFATGPDGALYMVDFYRRFVEHPDFVPRELRGGIDWRDGSDHGRIWRIIHRRHPAPRPRPLLNLAIAPIAGLVDHLASSNAWARDTAQRLLLERYNAESPAPANSTPSQASQNRPLLEAVGLIALASAPPVARVQALHTAFILRPSEPKFVLAAAADAHPRVRETSALLLGKMLELTPPGPPSRDEPAWLEVLRRLTRDDDARVRLAAALSLGYARDDLAREAALAPLLTLSTEPWLRLAAISGARSLSREQITALLPAPAKPFRPPPAPPAPAPDRQQVILDYTPALNLAGDRSRGAQRFAALCLACHHLQGRGHRLGPDLSGIASRPPAALLVDLLDPSRQIAPDALPYEATLTNDEILTGLIVSETETRIVLRHAGGPDVALPRQEIRSVRPLSKSLMPEGLETGLSHQDLADLLAFLKSPDVTLLPE